MHKGLALLSFWFGAAMGSAAIVLLALMTNSLSWSLNETPTNILYHYQTLVTGFLAVIAAAWAIRETRRQITQQSEQEADRRHRRNEAARTALPLALDELCAYAQACTRKLMALREYRTTVQTLYPNERFKMVTVPREMLNDFPIIPSSVISILSECVESADSNTAKAISALSSSLQIQHGRMLMVGNRQNRSADPLVELFKRDLDIYILDAIEIYARAENLFGFARSDFGKREFAPSRQNIKKTLIICDIHKEHYPEIWKRIDKEKRRASQITDQERDEDELDED